jgi:hypothetical protein
MTENYREVVDRVKRLMSKAHLAVVENQAARVEGYMASILATTDYHPDDYRLIVRTVQTAEGWDVYHWLEHKSVHREFAVAPDED